MSDSTHALAQKVISLLEQDLGAGGFQLLDVRIFRGGGRLQLRIYVDQPGGIDLSGCARASRTAEMLLEEANLIAERYVIEVSSPGIRRPLRTRQHFAEGIGQNVEVKTGEGRSARRLRGELLAAEAETIRLRLQESDQTGADGSPEAPVVNLAYADIREANLDPDFDAQALIQADRRQKKAVRRQERQTRRAKKPKRRPKT